MDTLHPHCAGLDVHKDTVVACVRHQPPLGRARKEVRTFPSHTAGLLELADWLAAEGVTHVAMESTGVYWKPVFHILEGRFELLLVNAQHLKNVPGRKTDPADASWIARLLQHGLLRPSFVPPPPVRELRDLTRQRTQLVGEKTAVANRIQKVLEDANVKLASVASDVLGMSGRAMLRALIRGESDPEQLAELARGRLRAKIPALRPALQGRVTEHHRFLLELLLDQVGQLEELIGRLEARITEVLAPFGDQVERLMTVPGISRTVAEVVLAEAGPDLQTFPSAGHLASWVGLCPANHESAGKATRGSGRKGNRWLRVALVQAAWAASHTKQTYLAAQYRRLAARRGRKRALVGVAHSLLHIVYHVLKDGRVYEELGGDYFDRLHGDRLTRHLVKRLESLGHRVTLEPVQRAG
ncbi:MAG TPA: IS110 family transposase [Gemmataceae bacterium]|nr:IS110 family transposase [Gemmataceae bacterium]